MMTTSPGDLLRQHRWRPVLAVLIPGGLIAALVTALITPPIDDAWQALYRSLRGGATTSARPVPPAPLAATIECADYCVTEQPKLTMRGTVTGELPPDHSLQLMVLSLQRNRWYPGTKVPVVDGRWTAQIHSGPKTRPSVDQHLKVCLVDAAAAFDRDLKSLITDVDKVNVEGLERKPEPMPELACVTVVRRGG